MTTCGINSSPEIRFGCSLQPHVYFAITVA
jgi:hypothetical protein